MSPDIWAGLDQAARAAALARRASFEPSASSSLAPPVPAPSPPMSVAPPVTAMPEHMSYQQRLEWMKAHPEFTPPAAPQAHPIETILGPKGGSTRSYQQRLAIARGETTEAEVDAANARSAAAANAPAPSTAPAAAPPTAAPATKVDPSTLLVTPQPKAPELAPQAFGGGSRPVAVPATTVPLVAPGIQAGIASSARDIAGDIDRQKLAEQESAQAKSATAQTENVANFPVAQEKKEQADLIQKQADDRRMASAGWQDKIGRLVDNLQNSKIDPNAGRHPVADTIGAILGGFMQGIGHLPSNPIADMIERRVNRAVEAQRADFENQRAGIRDQNTLYAKSMEETGNADQAEQLAKAHGLDIAKDKAQDMIRATLPAQYQADADKVGAVLDERKHGVLGAELKGEAGMNQYVPAHMAGGAGGTDLATEFRKYVTKWNNGDQKTPRMTWEEFKKSYQGYGAEASQKPGMNQRTVESVNAHKDAIANIDHLLSIIDKHPHGTAFARSDINDAEATAARTQEKIVAAIGKFNKGLLDRTMELIPNNPASVDWQSFLGDNSNRVRLQRARQMLSEELNREQGGPQAAASTPEELGATER